MYFDFIRGSAAYRRKTSPPWARIAVLASSLAVGAGGMALAVSAPANGAEPNAAEEALASIEIANSDDVRGNVTLPDEVLGFDVEWTSSDPAVVSTVADGPVAPGIVTRPAPDAEAAQVTLTACTDGDGAEICRDIDLTIRPRPGETAQATGYGMVTFRNSQSEKIFGATSEGNTALDWNATNDGEPMFTSTEGSTGLRDPSIVKSPYGDKYYMVATDLWTRDPNFNARGGWGWAQTGGSTYIEVWESDDLRTWSNQRHVEVNTSPETGMTFAPEAIWDPEIGAYVVYWSSAIYPEGTYYTTDLDDPNRRDTDSLRWGRNVTYYTTTRDFVNFTPSQVMYDRGGPDGIGTGTWITGYGNLDPQITYNPDDGYYYKTVQDRWDKVFDLLYTCPQSTTDLYYERSRSILAPAQDWELIKGCVTQSAVAGLGTAGYNEGGNLVKTNPGDPLGDGFLLTADGGWTTNEGVRRNNLQPYFASDPSAGNFKAVIDWNPPILSGTTQRAASHGMIFNATASEHAAFRGADLVSFEIATPPDRTSYALGEEFDPTGMTVKATYTDGLPGLEITEGFGGYTVSGYDPNVLGPQEVSVSFTVAGITKTATVRVDVGGPPAVDVAASVVTRCVAGKVVTVAVVTNVGDSPVDVVVDSEFGSKTLESLAAGQRRSQAFTTRQVDLPAGSMHLTAMAGDDTRTLTAEYAGKGCN